MVSKGAWSRSKMTASLLLPYISQGVIPEAKKNRWRIPGNEESPEPRRGEFVVFLSFLDRGLSFPTSLFLRKFLNFYSIKLTDLGPHSVQQISLFVVLCECYLNCSPYFPLWLSIFHGRITRERKDGPMVASGGITFQALSGGAFIDLALPKKAQADWRRYWFYMLESTPAIEQAIPEFTLELSVPRRLRVTRLPREHQKTVTEMRARIKSLKSAGLKAIDLYNCWLGRRLAPLRERGHLMSDYFGENDPSRSSKTEWSTEEYTKALKRITTAEFVGFDKGLAPYTAENPAPTV